MSKYVVKFDTFIVPEWKKVDGKLVKVGDIDEFEKIQENKNCALDVILDKFLTPIIDDGLVADDTIDYVDLTGKGNDLVDLAEWKNKLTEYRIMFNLDPFCSDDVVIAELKKRSDDYEKNIKRNLENMEKKENETN